MTKVDWRSLAATLNTLSEDEIKELLMLMNARNLLFHPGRRIHCGAGLGRGKGG